MTSPNAGNYSVTLDDATTVLSGRSSFKQHDSLLYFATGLDPGVNHTVEIVNQGGHELSLGVQGFGVYSRFVMTITLLHVSLRNLINQFTNP